jgi:hypothetical protein
MNIRCAVYISGYLLLAAASSPARAQIQTVDEALVLSKKTGRPIFALAGSKT